MHDSGVATSGTTGDGTPTAVSATMRNVCVFVRDTISCVGGAPGERPATQRRVAIWPEQFATGLNPCAVAGTGSITCLGTPRSGGWQPLRSPDPVADLRVHVGVALFVRGGEILVLWAPTVPSDGFVRSLARDVLDASVANGVAFLTQDGLFLEPYSAADAARVFLGPTPGATRLVCLSSAREAALVAWTPGERVYYWIDFHGASAVAHASVATEPLVAVTGYPMESAFCAIGESGRVFCADDDTLRCPSHFSAPTGVLTHEVRLPGAATGLSVGSGYACAIVTGDVYCWGTNRVGRMGDELPACVAEPTRIDLGLD